MSMLSESPVSAAIMRAALDCLAVVAPNGRIVQFNPAAERTFGYTREEVLQRPMVDLVNAPIFRALLDGSATDKLHTDELLALNQRVETTAYRADGAAFPVEMAVFAVPVESHHFFMAVIRDITERTENTRKLLLIKARLQQVIGSLQGGVMLEDENHRIELVNAVYCEMFLIPLPPAALIGRDWTYGTEDSRYLFADPGEFVRRMHQIVQDRQPAIGDVLHLKDGRVFTRDYMPIYNNDEFIGHLWHYHDFTEEFQTRRRWEQLFTLEELNKEIIRLFLQSDDIDAALNQTLAMTGHVFEVSRASVFHFSENERESNNTHEWCGPGVTPDIASLQGIPFDKFVPTFFTRLAEDGIITASSLDQLPEDMRSLYERMGVQSVLILPFYMGDRIEGIFRYSDMKGPRQWLPEEITTVRIIAESYARALEHQQSERQLIESRDAALHTAQLRSQFVANMSHEIRTPMTGVLGMLELLRETQLDEDQSEFAREAYNSAHRLLDIINDILDFSKLEAGQMTLKSESVDLRAIATEVRMTVSPHLSSKAVAFEVEVEPAVPTRVQGDSTRLRQVLMNLAGNAIKFTSAGHVTIRIHMLDSQADSAHIRFEVTDTGIGIPANYVQRVFDSFVQVDGTATRKYGGTGLGLAICKQFVELMGGTLDVESVQGAGSTFGFTLKMPVLAKTEATDDNLLANLRAVVLDNDKTARMVLSQQLENWRVNVVPLAFTSTNELRLALAEHATTENPLDLIFVRHKSPSVIDGVLVNSAPTGAMEAAFELVEQRHLHMLVRILDEKLIGAEIEDFVVNLIRPIRQSSLYNVLVRAAQMHTQFHATAAQPVSPASASETARSPTTANKPVETKMGRILLAEDHPMNADIVLTMLDELGAHIDVVENGREAIDQLEREHYDLVLMDIHMPVMDGAEATELIRASSTPYRDIPILALTASVMKQEQENYLRLGMNGVIMKPVSIRELRETVRSWLERAHKQPPNSG